MSEPMLIIPRLVGGSSRVMADSSQQLLLLTASADDQVYHETGVRYRPNRQIPNVYVQMEMKKKNNKDLSFVLTPSRHVSFHASLKLS